VPLGHNCCSASEMTYIVSSGALNSTHSGRNCRGAGRSGTKSDMYATV